MMNDRITNLRLISMRQSYFIYHLPLRIHLLFANSLLKHSLTYFNIYQNWPENIIIKLQSKAIIASERSWNDFAKMHWVAYGWNE
jgi:hypothetical protein